MAPRSTKEEQYSSEQQQEEEERTMQSVSFHNIACDVSDAHHQLLLPLKSAKCCSYKTGAASQGTFISADETYGNCCAGLTRRS